MKPRRKLPTVSTVDSTCRSSSFLASCLMYDLLIALLIRSLYNSLSLFGQLLFNDILIFFLSSGDRFYISQFILLYGQQKQKIIVKKVGCDSFYLSQQQYNNKMRSFIIKRKQKTNPSLRRVRSLQQNDRVRISTLGSDTQDRKTLFTAKTRQYSKSLTKTNVPYQGFIKEMKIKLPTPKQKFYQFLRIEPFNRNSNHNELISLFLKNIKFFKIHQDPLIENMAKKVYLVDMNQIQQKMMIIILQGQCFYQGQLFSAGQLITRRTLNKSLLSADYTTKLLAINRHEYVSFLSSYIKQQYAKIKDFINSIQLFKMLNQKTVNKCIENISLFYYLKGQRLYKIGDQANYLYVIFEGKTSRKVIIQIQKVNKIPNRKFQRQVRILSKTYSHRIQFKKQEIIGVTELIDGVNYRKQQINIDQDSILLGIDRRIIEQQLQDYIIDRLKKYNVKKYPQNYDQLCEFYQRQKEQMKKAQRRKINALQNSFIDTSSDKRKDKIKEIIKIYEQNIKLIENKNLISRKLHFDVDYTK